MSLPDLPVNLAKLALRKPLDADCAAGYNHLVKRYGQAEADRAWAEACRQLDIEDGVAESQL